MIEVNVTLFIQMANFLVLVFLMNHVLYRPIRRIVAQRREFFAERQSAIDKADADAKASAEQMNLRIQDARRQGRQGILDLKAQAYEQEKTLLQSATEDAAGQIQEMREQIKKDIEGARKKLSGQVKTFSQELAQKILGRSL
jgi:F-type H+-transporting ATPase subunit b